MRIKTPRLLVNRCGVYYFRVKTADSNPVDGLFIQTKQARKKTKPYKSKTPGGIPNVPISDALIGLGFLDYVEECRAAGTERLFPHLALINHSYSKELSAAMLAHQRDRGIKAPQTSFHSFRVNVVTELHNKNANAAKVIKIVGHDDGGGHDVHWGYVRELPDCKEIVDMLDWPIGLAALRYDGRFVGFLADGNNWAAEQTADEAPKA